MAWLLVGPIVALAISLVALEGWRQLRPRSPLFGDPFVYSLADAIEQGNVPAAYAFIRDGQDPNEAIAVRHDVLTLGEQIVVTPLAWAIATAYLTGRLDTVQMLLGHGAALDDRLTRDAVCVAMWLGDEPTATAVRRYARVEGTVPCPAMPRDRPPVFVLSSGERFER